MRQALATAGLAVGTGIATLTACGSAMSGYDPTVPTNIIYVDGGDQRGRVDTPLRYPLRAKITNQFGSPVTGVRVDWYVVNGRGILGDSTSVSDGEGMVCNTLMLGLNPETIRVQAVTPLAALSGSPVYFNASALRSSSDRWRAGGVHACALRPVSKPSYCLPVAQ